MSDSLKAAILHSRASLLGLRVAAMQAENTYCNINEFSMPYTEEQFMRLAKEFKLTDEDINRLILQGEL